MIKGCGNEDYDSYWRNPRYLIKIDFSILNLLSKKIKSGDNKGLQDSRGQKYKGTK